MDDRKFKNKKKEKKISHRTVKVNRNKDDTLLIERSPQYSEIVESCRKKCIIEARIRRSVTQPFLIDKTSAGGGHASFQREGKREKLLMAQ